jgi:hypothetical protein
LSSTEKSRLAARFAVAAALVLVPLGAVAAPALADAPAPSGTAIDWDHHDGPWDRDRDHGDRDRHDGDWDRHDGDWDHHDGDWDRHDGDWDRHDGPGRWLPPTGSSF